MSRPTLLPLSLFVFGCTGSTLPPVSEIDRSADDDIIAGEFIITEDLPESIALDLGIRQVDFDGNLKAGLYVAEDLGIGRAALEVTLKQRIRDTLTVQHNRAVTASAADPYRDLQWNLDMLDIETAWERATGAGVTVAVIDSGVSWAGEDRPASLVAGWDFVDDDADPSDENGHGTHVAGTIAQATGNGRGVAGVAPDATLLVYRVLDRYGSGSVYWSAKAILAATDAGADVINLSLGASRPTDIEADAVAYAARAGVVLVAASGNDGKGSLDYPAGYPDVLSVGAVGPTGRVTAYSNGGDGLDLVAPGGDLALDANRDGYADGILQETDDGYVFLEGTSMATPHVAGAAALLIAAGAPQEGVADLLLAHATDLEGAGWDTWSGYGLLDVVAALNAVDAAGVEAPPSSTADTTAPFISGVGGSRSGTTLTLTWTTDEPATTEVEFETYGWFGDTETYTVSHEMTFTIDRNTTYVFTLAATDAAGNRSTDGAWVSAP